jgi:hypothetical protein
MGAIDGGAGGCTPRAVRSGLGAIRGFTSLSVSPQLSLVYDETIALCVRSDVIRRLNWCHN